MKFSSEKNLLSQLRQTVFRRMLLIISVFLLVVTSGMFATFLITPKYEATMSILVSRERTDPQINPSDKNSEITQAAISDEEFNSELELVKSIEVITGVVKELDLANDQKPKEDTWLGSLRARVKSSLYGFTVSAKTEDSGKEESSENDFSIEKTVNRVEANLDVVPIKKSRIIKITYTDTDPVRAKKTLEKLYQKYVELHVQINDKPQAAQVFNEQSDKFNRKLNDSTDALKQFDAKNGVTGAEIGTQRELLLKQLYDAQALENATRTEIGETEKRIADLKEKIATQPERIQTGSVSKYVSAIDRMKEELVQLEQQRTQLLQKYQPNSRFVRENEERIRQLKKTITEETANPPEERSFALNDLRRRLESDLANAQTSLAALKEREKNLSQQASKLSGEVVSLNGKSIERDSLERKKNINEEAYLLYQKKARENEISQVLNREQVMNFSLVDAPRTDGEQKNPKPLLNLLVLITVGASAGFAGAIVLDKLTAVDAAGANYDLIVSAREIEQRLNLPLLAFIVEPPKTVKAVLTAKRLALAPPEVKGSGKIIVGKNY
jgi:uncharacterized protein involved in exopolysaccharide biosynthesis